MHKFQHLEGKAWVMSQFSFIIFPVNSLISTKEREASISWPDFQWHTALEYSKPHFFFWIPFPFPHVYDYGIISSIIRGSRFPFHMNDDELWFKMVWTFLKMPEDKLKLHFHFKRLESKEVPSCFDASIVPSSRQHCVCFGFVHFFSPGPKTIEMNYFLFSC